MASFASVSPPFHYDPSCKPTKSILKHNVPLNAQPSSWLSRLSLATTSSEADTPQSSQQHGPQRSFSLFRKLIANPPQQALDTALPPSTPIAQGHSLNAIAEDDLQQKELKRVRFPVGQLKTEYYPYRDTSEATIEPNTAEKSDPDVASPCQDACVGSGTNPRDLAALYKAACRNKEESAIQGVMTTLTAHQNDSQIIKMDISRFAINRRAAEPLADIFCLNFGLENLVLDHCDLEDDAIKILLHSLLLNDNIQKLSLSNNHRLKTNGFKYIAIYVKSSARLTSLDLSFTNPDKKAIQYLAQAVASSPSGRTPSLQKLILDGCALKPPLLEILAKGIRSSICLRHVSLCNNRITQQGAEWIGVMLVDYNTPDNTQGLETLELDHNEIRQGVAYIAQALRRNKNLRSLSMRNCKMDPKGLSLVGEALKYNQGLKTLDIGHNSLYAQSMEGITALKQALYVNRALAELCLSATGLESEAAVALAECLCENTSLVRLDLTDNDAIDLAGALALAASIKNNSALTHVGISVPINDRDMARCQNDIFATCTRNEQAKRDELDNAQAPISPEPEVMTTKTLATAHLTLQERLAAVTRGASLSRSSSTRSSIAATDNATQRNNLIRKRRDTELFDIVTTRANLMNDMISAEVEMRSHDDVVRLPDDTIIQLYHQCQEAHTAIGLKVTETSDEGQLALLLGLNDHLMSILAKYNQLYPSPADTEQTATTVTDHPIASVPELPLSPSFEIGDDDDEDGDDDSTVPTDSQTPSNTVNILELRRLKEVEEGTVFKHAKEAENTKEAEV